MLFYFIEVNFRAIINLRLSPHGTKNTGITKRIHQAGRYTAAGNKQIRPAGRSGGHMERQFGLEPERCGLDSSNMNAQLAAAITGQTIGNVTEINVDTNNAGGSIANIPFVQGHVSPSRFQSTFWIEEVLTDSLNFLQLQYSQQTNLNFLSKNTQPPSGVIMWPHANVNTLRKV